MDDPLNKPDNQWASGPRRPRWLPWLIVPLLLLGAWFIWSHQRADQERQQQLVDEGFTLVRVLSSTFSKANELKVGDVSGKFQISTRDAGWGGIFPSSQTIRIPYSIGYVLDMSQLDADDYRWDSRTRTLVVRLPPLRETEPNIDESRIEVLDRDGLWISRRAQEQLNKRATTGAIKQAKAEAANPIKRADAEANAKVVVADLLRTPLSVAGMTGVEVIALGSAETPENKNARERWDVSRSIAEVLEEARRKREGAQ